MLTSNGLFLGSDDAMLTSNEVLLGSNVAMLTSNEVLLGSNAAMLTSNEILLGSNAVMLTSNEVLLGSNVAMLTSNNILLGSNVAMLTSNEVLLGSNAVMLTSKMTMPDCRSGIRGDIARKHADVRRRTNDKASHLSFVILGAAKDLAFSCATAKLSRAARASHFCFGRSNQDHLRRTLTDAMKPHRFPALLSKNGPPRTRTSMCSDIRALLPLLLPVLGSLYGAKSQSTATAKGGLTSFAVRSGASLIRPTSLIP